MFALLLATLTTIAAEPAVIPRPVTMEVREGAPFEFKSGTVVLAREAGEALHHVTDLVKACTGETPRVVRSSLGQSSVPMITVERQLSLGAEAYELSVGGLRCDIRYGDDAGLFYAVQTLRQLLPPAVENPAFRDAVRWTVPAVEVKDKPRFSWRGMHLDVSRHFFPLTFITRFSD